MCSCTGHQVTRRKSFRSPYKRIYIFFLKLANKYKLFSLFKRLKEKFKKMNFLPAWLSQQKLVTALLSVSLLIIPCLKEHPNQMTAFTQFEQRWRRRKDSQVLIGLMKNSRSECFFHLVVLTWFFPPPGFTGGKVFLQPRVSYVGFVFLQKCKKNFPFLHRL